MFNQQVNQHKQSQLLNPFAQTDGRVSPKPTFSKDEYGKPLAGSLTEMRGQKANIHVLKEMLELCQIIDSEGYNVKDEPGMRVIPFGELFNIYNYISDKVVGILLRARKHKLVEFEGEMLFQRRDDDVPIFLLKPISEIRRETNEKIENIKRCGSPAPQATSVLLDKKAHGLDVPKGKGSQSSTPQSSKAPTPQSSKAPTPQSSKAPTPQSSKAPSPAPEANKVETPKIQISGEPEKVKSSPQEVQSEENKTETVEPEKAPKENEVPVAQDASSSPQTQQPTEEPTKVVEASPEQATSTPVTETLAAEDKSDVNNNPAPELPVVVIEASAVYVRANNNEGAPETSNETVSSTAVNDPAAEATPVA
ncbi:uncharacterized protein LOC142228265 isoform X2 [Haematobia irritans]